MLRLSDGGKEPLNLMRSHAFLQGMRHRHGAWSTVEPRHVFQGRSFPVHYGSRRHTAWSVAVSLGRLRRWIACLI